MYINKIKGIVYIVVAVLFISLTACDNNKQENNTVIPSVNKVQIPFSVKVGDSIRYEINIKEQYEEFDPKAKRAAELSHLSGGRASYSILKNPSDSTAVINLEVVDVNDTNIVIKAQFTHIVRKVQSAYVSFLIDTDKGEPVGDFGGAVINAHQNSDQQRTGNLYKNLVQQTFYIELTKDGGFVKLKDYPSLLVLDKKQGKLTGKEYEKWMDINIRLLWLYNEQDISNLFALLFPSRKNAVVSTNDVLHSNYTFPIENFTLDFNVLNTDNNEVLYKTSFDNKIDERNMLSFSYVGQLKTWPETGEFIFKKQFEKENLSLSRKLITQVNIVRNIKVYRQK